MFSTVLSSHLSLDYVNNTHYALEPSDKLVNNLMSKLLQNPHRHLHTEDNNSLMRVFEAYRHLLDQNEDLREEIKLQRASSSRMQENHDQAKHSLQQELAEYKMEVKRLELVIAQGQNGAMDVLHVRQESILSKRRKTRHFDHEPTPSHDVMDFFDRLARSAGRNMSNQRAFMRPKAVIASTPDSIDDSLHNDSTDDDRLVMSAERAMQSRAVLSPVKHHMHLPSSTAPSPVRETLRHIFSPHPEPASWSGRSAAKKTPLLKKQPSGLFGRLRHQASTDAVRTPSRVFSFDVGDDLSPLSKQGLTKCISNNSLQTQSTRPAPLTLVSSNSRSSSISLGEVRRQSMIPSPVFPSGAKPRQQRENSSSSNVTISQSLSAAEL